MGSLTDLPKPEKCACQSETCPVCNWTPWRGTHNLTIAQGLGLFYVDPRFHREHLYDILEREGWAPELAFQIPAWGGDSF